MPQFFLVGPPGFPQEFPARLAGVILFELLLGVSHEYTSEQ